MRLLNKFSGGRGFYVDDVEALQTQISQLRQYVLSDGNYVLGGCAAFPSSIGVGVVMLGGSMVYNPGLSVSQYPCWVRRLPSVSEGPRFYDLDQGTFDAFLNIPLEVVYSDPGGDRIRFDTNSRYDYKDYLAEVFDIAGINSTLGTKAATSTVNGQVSGLQSQIDDKAEQALSTAWTNLSLLTGVSVYDNSGQQTQTFTPSTPQYCKDSFGFVQFRGQMSWDDGSNPVAFTLPTGHRPVADHPFYAHSPDAGGGRDLMITTAGQCKYVGIPTGSAKGYMLNQFPPFYAI